MLHTEVPTEPRPLPDGPLYFVGVGGAGMSALAQVLAERGRPVTGSDPGIAPAVKERLERVGVTVYTVHDAGQVGDAAAVVVSDAVPESNPEVILAREKGIPIFRRPEVLGAIVNAGRGIAIAGTHGKTTTTGMVASILLAAGLDPTILIGGDLPLIGGNARNGKGDIVVAEACEAYDGFLYLHPEIAVITNIEADHLDYHGTEEHVFASFERFVRQVKPGGTRVIHGHASTAKILPNYSDLITRYSDTEDELMEDEPDDTEDDSGNEDEFDNEKEQNDVDQTLNESRETILYDVDFVKPYISNLTTEDLDLSGPTPSFFFHYCLCRLSPRVTLRVPGEHNVLNALAATAVAFSLGLYPDVVVAGLESFTGTGRRFERIGESGSILIVDDYAHHPTEIRATLAAARSAYPDRRLVAVFQPHLPSRTRDLMDDFADALTGANAVYVTDIYLAREQPIPGISSETLAAKVGERKPSLPVAYVPDKNDLPTRLAVDIRPGDLVLTMGAGDIRKAAEGLLKLLEDKVTNG